jgi:adenylate kinase family enzyme
MSLPDILLLYGPPTSGKGTQAHHLKILYPNYYHIDFGAILRNFIDKNPTSMVSVSLQEKMSKGEAVDSNLLWQVIGEDLEKHCQLKHKLIIEGLGRKLEDAIFFSKIIERYNLSLAIFHLCLPLEYAILRSNTRYYVKDNTLPFSSYEDALSAANNQIQNIWRRTDDGDKAIIEKRYINLYENIYPKILHILQISCLAPVYIVEATLPITEVTNQITTYLDKFYRNQ